MSHGGIPRAPALAFDRSNLGCAAGRHPISFQAPNTAFLRAGGALQKDAVGAGEYRLTPSGVSGVRRREALRLSAVTMLEEKLGTQCVHALVQHAVHSRLCTAQRAYQWPAPGSTLGNTGFDHTRARALVLAQVRDARQAAWLVRRRAGGPRRASRQVACQATAWAGGCLASTSTHKPEREAWPEGKPPGGAACPDGGRRALVGRRRAAGGAGSGERSDPAGAHGAERAAACSAACGVRRGCRPPGATVVRTAFPQPHRFGDWWAWVRRTPNAGVDRSMERDSGLRARCAAWWAAGLEPAVGGCRPLPPRRRGASHLQAAAGVRW